MADIKTIGNFIDQASSAIPTKGMGHKHEIAGDVMTRSISADCLPTQAMVQASESALDEADEDEDEDEDDVPLSKSRGMLRKASMPMLGTSTSASTSAYAANPHTADTSTQLLALRAEHLAASIRPVATQALHANHTHRSEQTLSRHSRTVSKDWALAEVARARERRAMLERGEVDRLAEGEQRRKEEGKRRSMMFEQEMRKQEQNKSRLKAQSTGGSARLGEEEKVKRQSSVSLVRLAQHQQQGNRPASSIAAPSATPVEGRRRTQSSAVARTRGQAQRFHSFYEAPVPASPSTTQFSADSGKNAQQNVQTPPRSHTQLQQARTASMYSVNNAMSSAPSMQQMQMGMGMGMPYSQAEAQMDMYHQPYHLQQHQLQQQQHQMQMRMQMQMQRPLSMMMPVMPTPLAYQQQQQHAASPVSMAQHLNAMPQHRRASPSSGRITKMSPGANGGGASAVVVVVF